MTPDILPVVLSGGSGSRLWPVSRRSYPKQFLALHGADTMLRETLGRVAPLGARALILCADAQRFQVAEQAQGLDLPVEIYLEPLARNTALAAAVAALVAAQSDPGTVLLLTPADHYIPDSAAFQAAARTAAGLAAQGHIVTFGIAPTAPETGYGYIRRGEALGPGARVSAFKEKPEPTTAKEFLASGDYLWNAGIFAAPAGLLLTEMRRHAPRIVEAAEAALSGAVRDLDFIRLARDPLEPCPDLSIDYAVMEHTDHAAVLPVDFRWSDLGSWAAMWQIAAEGADQNATLGPVVLRDTRRSYIRSEGPVVAVSGVEDVVVVATDDAVLVIDRNHAEEVKPLLDAMREEDRREAVEHKRIHRPWGSYESLATGNRFQVKRISVKPGGILSLQSHLHRAEHWVVVSGTAEVTIGEAVTMVTENQSVFVPLGAVHRLANRGKVDLILIEVQSGSYLGEDDIVRYEDVYART